MDNPLSDEAKAILATGRVSGLQMMHHGISACDLYDAGWRTASLNEDAMVAPAVEIPVTKEMIAAGHKHVSCVGGLVDPVVVYRAMAALAPKADGDLHRMLGRDVQIMREQDDRLTALEAKNAELRRNCEGWAVLAQHYAAEVVVLRATATATPAAFGPATDTPDAPRRPDGTLAPVAKPLPVLKTANDGRRVGG